MKTTEYRAVVKYATGNRETVSMSSPWMPRKEPAEEILEDMRPFNEEYGSWFDGYIEEKSKHKNDN